MDAATGPARVQIDVLGPLRVRGPDGDDLTPPGALQCRLLALLAVRSGATVSPEVLADALWPDRAPNHPAAALQTHVFRLRRTLGEGAIASTSSGYRLEPAAVDLDADRLTEAVSTALAVRATDPQAAVDAVDAGLASWRGTPYPELVDTDEGRAEAVRLSEARVRALEERADALVALGRADEVVADLVALADEHPLRERPRSLLMAALAATGRTAEALRIYDDFRRAVGDELGIEPSPALAEQHAALLDHGPQPPRNRRATDMRTVTSRLPAAVDSLVGRDVLVDEVLELVDGNRLVTLLGTGGVGKTRLVVEVGRRLIDRFPDRPVVLCELAGSTVESAVDAVATALSTEPRAGTDLVDRITEVLHDRDALLILDNCEHVLDPVARLAERILADAPGVSLLTTSRERLRVAGERLCTVTPLPMADDGEGIPAAVQLFVDRTRAVRPDFDPGPDELATVVEVVRRLDGLPLAIELAAARMHTMELAEVAAGLDRRFRLLTSGPRTTSRHRSLGAAVAWSHGLLDPDLQRCFEALSAFAGPFDAQAAAAICDRDPVDMTDALVDLTERSLVSRAGDGRWMLLDSLRAFGAEQLVAQGREREVGDRHATHVLGWTQGAVARLSTSRSADTVLADIDDRLPDLRAALRWMIDDGDLDGAGQLVTSLHDYGFLRLRPEVLLWAERLLALDPDEQHPLTPAVSAVAALGAWMAGDVQTTGARAERALALHEASGAPVMSRLVAQIQGSHALFEGRLDDAAVWYRRGYELAGSDRNSWLVGAACEVLAFAYAGSPATAGAVDGLLRELGDECSPAASFAWYAAGEAELGGDIALARERFDRALEQAEVTGAMLVTGVAGASAASIEARVGDPEEAAEWYRQLVLHWRHAGMWSTQWTMLRTIAELLGRLDRAPEAAVLVGAVTTTDEGHRLFGVDAEALDVLGRSLRERLGDDAYERCWREGASLDGAAAVEHALRSL